MFVLGSGWLGCTNITFTLQPDNVAVISNFNPSNNGQFIATFESEDSPTTGSKTLQATGTGTGCTASTCRR